MSLQETAKRHLQASRDVIGDTLAKPRKALPMPYPLNDDEVLADPERWRAHLIHHTQRPS